MSALAPRKFSSGRENITDKTEKASVVTAPPQKPKAETYLLFSRSPAPIWREIRLLAPMPNRLPSAVSRLNQGETTVTAATMLGLPIWPTKNVSPRL